MPYLQHDGIEFYFEEHGNGPPFVFSHGLGANVNQVLSLLRDLPNTHLILYDNRAHGRTKPLGDAAKLNFDVMADDVAALLDSLNFPTAFVGGVSMGAGVGLNFAVRHPHRVKALVLSRPAWLDQGRPPHLSVFSIIAELVGRLGVEQARYEFERTTLYGNLQKDNPPTAKSPCDLFSNNTAEAIVTAFQPIYTSRPVDSLDSLQRLQIPSLVLANHNDPLHPFELAQVLASRLPKCQLRQFPSKSESVAQHYEQFRRLVGEFVTTVDGQLANL
jgi:pimeloyl-ACP methyl ester carboxylesterase